VTDKFIDRVAKLATQTKQALNDIAEELDFAGLPAQARTLRSIAKEQSRLAIDCLATTQSIEPNLFNFKKRVKKCVENLHELATDLMANSHSGHSEVSEAAKIIERLLEEQSEENFPGNGAGEL